MYVQQTSPVVSYLTALTGLTRETLDSYGIPLDRAMAALRENLPKSAILVGQNIRKDVEWLGLKEGVDFESLMDLVGYIPPPSWLARMEHMGSPSYPTHAAWVSLRHGPAMHW